MFSRKFQSVYHLVSLNGSKSLQIVALGTAYRRTRNNGAWSLPQRSFSLCMPSVHSRHSNVLAQTKVSRSIVSYQELSSTTSDMTIDFTAKIAEGKQILEEYRAKGLSVPNRVADDNLAYLATLSKTKRGSYVSKLVKKEFDKLNKSQKKSCPQVGEEEVEPLELKRILRRYSKQDYNEGDAWRLAAAMKFNPQIVLDFVHDDLMNWREIRHLVTQLAYVLNVNKLARQPFHLHFVNYHYGSLVEQELKKIYQDQYDHLLVSISDKGLCDVFPQENIVYLSPDSDKILTSYNPNKVYVIGALVDLKHETGATLSQAKRLSVEHQRFPLDMYLQWSNSHKSLTLDAVMNILVDLVEHVDMATTLQKNVPKRKHVGVRIGAQVFNDSPQSTFVSSRAKRSRKWNIDDEGDNIAPRKPIRRQRHFDVW